MDCCKQLKALSEPKRIEILQHLFQQNGLCVCQLVDLVDMPQSKLSYHLKVLLDACLLTKSEIGVSNVYQVNEEELRKVLSEKAIGFILSERRGRKDGKEML